MAIHRLQPREIKQLLLLFYLFLNLILLLFLAPNNLKQFESFLRNMRIFSQQLLRTFLEELVLRGVICRIWTV